MTNKNRCALTFAFALEFCEMSLSTSESQLKLKPEVKSGHKNNNNIGHIRITQQQ